MFIHLVYNEDKIFIWYKKGRINNLVDVILLLMYIKMFQGKNMKHYLAISICVFSSTSENETMILCFKNMTLKI